MRPATGKPPGFSLRTTLPRGAFGLRGGNRPRPVEPDPAETGVGKERGMPDIPTRTDPRVTTGPIRGSRKIHVEGRDGVRVAMRAVDLEPSSGEPPLVLYDTSGPYTDPDARIDIMAGLPELRAEWVRSRGDVEEVAQR